MRLRPKRPLQPILQENLLLQLKQRVFLTPNTTASRIVLMDIHHKLGSQLITYCSLDLRKKAFLYGYGVETRLEHVQLSKSLSGSVIIYSWRVISVYQNHLLIVTIRPIDSLKGIQNLTYVLRILRSQKDRQRRT